jgi:phage host-nuclease inhibitor protein Gam
VLRSEREVAMVREQMDDMDREISSLKRELNEKNNKIRVSYAILRKIREFNVLIIDLIGSSRLSGSFGSG